MIFDSGCDYRITMPGQDGIIRLPDYFFTQFDERLERTMLFGGETDEFWHIPSHLMSSSILESKIPRYFKDSGINSIENLNTYEIPIDIFGICFYLLSRMEEHEYKVLDQHGRFSALSSRNYSLGVLNRPIVDELTELLWNAISSRWPQLARKKQSFSIELSHDVDHPSRYKFCNLKLLFKRVAKDIFYNRKSKSCFSGLVSRVRLDSSIAYDDPYYNFDWIMDQSENRGLKSTFFYMCGGSHPLYDSGYDIFSPELKNIIDNIDARGHKSGIHPSYQCFDDRKTLNKELIKWHSIIAKYSLRHAKPISRMHYLRFSTEITPALLEVLGVTDDYTMGYADHIGFRAGTCRPYNFFDISLRRELKLVINPLCAMEGTVLNYMQQEHDVAYESFMDIKRACMRVNGNFSLLWHNSELVTDLDRDLYLSILDGR